MTDAEWAIIQPMAQRKGLAESSLGAAKQALAAAQAAAPLNLRTVVEATIAVQLAKEELDTSNTVLKNKIQTTFKLQST